MGTHAKFKLRSGTCASPLRSQMASIALMHVTPNGVKYPSGSVKPALRWFFEGTSENCQKIPKNATKVNSVVCARKPPRASPMPRPRVSLEVAIFYSHSYRGTEPHFYSLRYYCTHCLRCLRYMSTCEGSRDNERNEGRMGQHIGGVHVNKAL